LRTGKKNKKNKSVLKQMKKAKKKAKKQARKAAEAVEDAVEDVVDAAEDVAKDVVAAAERTMEELQDMAKRAFKKILEAAANAMVAACVEINWSGSACGEEPAPPRHRAGVASTAWRTTRRFSTNVQKNFDFHTADDSSNTSPSPAPGKRVSRPTCLNHGRVAASAPRQRSGTASGENASSFVSCARQVVAATKVGGATRGALVVGLRFVPTDERRRGRPASAHAAARQAAIFIIIGGLPPPFPPLWASGVTL
jgi:enamine deaminase RidA (YjgF/YER057c/UK114 family)